MEVMNRAQFVSPRIQTRFQEKAETFRQEANDSKVANKIIELLYSSESDKRYATGGRNACVKRLAEDVEVSLGMQANLMFRTPGALHDALQTLMDAYEDAMDGIYYHKE